jgi:hypothetical protein
MARLELDEYVDVALGPEVVSQDRAKQGEAANVMAPAEVGEGRPVDGDARRHRYHRSRRMEPAPMGVGLPNCGSGSDREYSVNRTGPVSALAPSPPQAALSGSFAGGTMQVPARHAVARESSSARRPVA